MLQRETSSAYRGGIILLVMHLVDFFGRHIVHSCSALHNSWYRMIPLIYHDKYLSPLRCDTNILLVLRSRNKTS